MYVYYTFSWDLRMASSKNINYNALLTTDTTFSEY